MPPFWTRAEGRPPLVVGHRGVRREDVVENTPEAFQTAAAEGADAVELDVRRSADGVPVVHHDAVFDGGVIVDTAAASLEAAGMFSLADVAAQLPPGLGVDLEFKNLPHDPDFDESESLVGLVADVVAAMARDRPVLVSSFSPFTVEALGRVLPDVTRGLVTLRSVAVDMGVKLAAEYGASVLCPQLGAAGLDGDGVARAHEAGLALLAWDLGNTDSLVALAPTGIDAICVDDVAWARERLLRA